LTNNQKIIPLNSYQYDDLLRKYQELKELVNILIEKIEAKK